jgi:P27 family predicted phage terminase small subunit
MAKSKGTTGTRMVGVDNTAFIPKVKAPTSMTPAAKKVWKELIEQIPNENIIPSDTPLMEAYCETMVAYRAAVQNVNREGVTLETAAGGITMNPEATWMDKCSSKLATLAAKLRLAPSARMELAGTKGKQAASKPTTALGKLIKR